jgi:hypothetical protein
MNLQKGIIIVGVRNQRPAVNWPDVVMSAVIVAIGVAAGSCGIWYMLAGEMPNLPRIFGGTCFFTMMFVGIGIRKGLATPIAQLRSLD